MTKHCETCGQIIVPQATGLTRTQQRIFDAVKRRGEIDYRSLMDAVYGDQVDGGPECADTLSVHICMMNRRLKKHGVAVRSTMGRYAVYRIVEIKQ